jgi:hypothetical protein
LSANEAWLVKAVANTREAPGAGLSRQHGHARRQVAAGDAVGQAVDAVREHADRDARPVHAVDRAQLVGPMGDVALGGVDLAREGASGRRHAPHLGQLGHALEIGQGQAGAHGPVARRGVEHAAADGGDAPGQRRGHAAVHVHRDLPVGVDRDARAQGADAGDGVAAARHAALVEQLRADLALDRRAPGLVAQDRGDGAAVAGWTLGEGAGRGHQPQERRDRECGPLDGPGRGHRATSPSGSARG